jgi:ABC-type nitrate/sulfonate/bicarbonate transport system permease component
MKKRAPGFFLILVLLALWELSAKQGWVDTVDVPRVSTIFGSWYHEIVTGTLVHQLLPSLQRLFGGFFLAVITAVPIGLLMGTVPFIYRLLEPITEFLRPIPSSAYIPVTILFLGIDDGMKVFVVYLGCFFPILLNTYGGVRGIDQVLIDTGRTFGLSRTKALRQIILPAALPSVLTGMRISLGIALIVVVVAEMIAGNSGIGYFILDRQRVFRVPEMFAGIFTLGLLGYLLNFAFLQIERHFLRWRGTAEAS